MNRKITLTTILAFMLLTSACSQNQYSHTPRKQSYAYRTPQHQQQYRQQQPQKSQAQQNQPQQEPTTPIASQNIPQQSNQPLSNQPLSSPVRNQMVSIIKGTIGTPYKWGGNTPQRGFDCSGLMSYVHKNALGLKIPRTAAMQRDNSRTINYEQILPGDMLFFKTGVKTNHVGMYIGNRKFIHAPSGSKRVKIASMDSSYWHKRFVKFGTYLN